MATFTTNAQDKALDDLALEVAPLTLSVKPVLTGGKVFAEAEHDDARYDFLRGTVHGYRVDADGTVHGPFVRARQ